MKVKELKEMLNQFDDELEVYQDYDGMLLHNIRLEKTTKADWYRFHMGKNLPDMDKEIVVIL